VSAFFGLTPEYKKIILDEIFTLCYHSNGGFTHDEAYNMPIRYRHYYIHKINETHQHQQEMMDHKFNKSSNNEPNKRPKEPPIIPDFVSTARAPKK